MSIEAQIESLATARNTIRNKMISEGQATRNDKLATLAENLVISSGTDTSDATATADDIMTGKTAYVNGEKITGNITIATSAEITQIVKNIFNGGSYEKEKITSIKIIPDSDNVHMDNPITADKIKEAYPDPSVLAKVIGYRTNEDTSETVDLTNKGAVMEWGNIEVYNDWMALATITAYYDGIRTDAGEEYMFESSYNINFNAY